MEALPFPTLPYLLVEAIVWPLTLTCLVWSWFRERPMFYTLIASMLFAFAVEYQALTTEPLPYHYTEAIVTLPGQLPLGVVLGWSITFFAVIKIARATQIHWAVQPLMAGLLAVLTDFVTDPAFVEGLGFWVWNMPGDWFGIPWDNYVGWLAIVASFLFASNLAWRKYPPGGKWWRDLLVAVLATIPAFVIFAGFMKFYLWIEGMNLVPNVILLLAVLGLALLPVLWQIPKMKRDNTPELIVLAVPIALFLISLTILFTSGLVTRLQELAIVMPLFAALAMVIFRFPYSKRA